jgi:hypothetical protein
VWDMFGFVRPILGLADGCEAGSGRGGLSRLELLPGWPMFQESQTVGAERPYKSSVVHVLLEGDTLLLQSFRLHPSQKARCFLARPRPPLLLLLLLPLLLLLLLLVLALALARLAIPLNDSWNG